MFAVADTADLDDGPRPPKFATERMCAVTRGVRPIDELIRFVLAPDGTVAPDLKRKLPGRGLWVTASHKSVAEAERKNAFARGFKKPVRAQPALADRTGDLLAASALDALAIAAKAGQIVTGFTKVETALAQRQAVALIQASDGSPDGLRKLDSVARRAYTDAPITIVSAFASAQLDLALARTNVIHAALLAGAASATSLARCHILVRYRMLDGAAAATALPQNQTNTDGAGAPGENEIGTA